MTTWMPTLKRAASALERGGVPYLLAGSVACWARGALEVDTDLDFVVKPADRERAIEALVQAGMREERPAEQWLLKARDGATLVDVIFEPMGMQVTDEVIARGETLNVGGMWVRVMALDDVVTTKLLALDEHSLDYERLLQIARALREQIHWADVRARTEHSPYARAFFTLAEGLGVAPRSAGHDATSPRVRIVGGQP
ncbi:MAG TPA: nucleotidyltransferase [Solirubrobacterales bacterium]|nr:nucleotidyltransferase [Solirubrobacterales bacterium]